MKLSFLRLEKYIAVQPTAAMMDMVVKLMVEVISILGIATKEIVQGQFRMSFHCPCSIYCRNLMSHAEKYVKKLFGFHILEDSFQRLDEFTIEILTIAARIDEDLIHVDQLHNVDANIHSVVHEVSFTNTGDLFLSSLGLEVRSHRVRLGVRREGIRAYKRVSDINRL